MNPSPHGRALQSLRPFLHLGVSVSRPLTGSRAFWARRPRGGRAFSVSFGLRANSNTDPKDGGHGNDVVSTPSWTTLPKPRPGYSFTVLTNVPESLAPEDVSYAIVKAKVPLLTRPLVVVLVSPGLTAWLDDGSRFIPSLLEQLYRDEPDGKNVDVVAAVVDRIPFPSGNMDLRRVLLESNALGATASVPANELRTELGSEGVSVMITESESAAPGLWNGQHPSEKMGNSDEGQTGCISIKFWPLEPIMKRWFGPPNWRPLLVPSVQIPLAKTIFRNGKTTTLVVQSWKVNFTSLQKRDLMPERKSRLSHLMLHLVGPRSPFPTDIIHAPPGRVISPPRTVLDCMGNILREFLDETSTGERLPASRDLEEILPHIQKVAARLERPDLEIWAMVTPKERFMHSPHANVSTSSLILLGTRMHRILSGGGGWGQKEGLIAIEPEVNFGNSLSATVDASTMDMDSEIGQFTLPSEPVRPGDVVQFLSCNSSSLPVDDTLPLEKSMQVIGRHSMKFGSIPMHADEVPQREQTGARRTLVPRRFVVYNFFGALSTQGLAFAADTVGPFGEARYGSERLGNIVQTKLPPFSSVRFGEGGSGVEAREIFDRADNSAHARGETQPNPTPPLNSEVNVRPRVRKVGRCLKGNKKGAKNVAEHVPEEVTSEDPTLSKKEWAAGGAYEWPLDSDGDSFGTLRPRKGVVNLEDSLSKAPPVPNPIVSQILRAEQELESRARRSEDFFSTRTSDQDDEGKEEQETGVPSPEDEERGK